MPRSIKLKESELLAAEVMEQANFNVEKIPEQSTKTPDFQCSSSLGGLNFLMEVKETDDNSRELIIANAAMNEVVVGEVEFTGARFSPLIKTASTQFKEYNTAGLPSLLAIKDGRNFFAKSFYPFMELHYAMFGIKVDWFNPRTGLTESFRAKRDRRLTADRGTMISAIGIMSEVNSRVEMDVIHNPHATFPFRVPFFQASNIREYVIHSTESYSDPILVPMTI